MPVHYRGEQWSPGPQLEASHTNTKKTPALFKGTPIGKAPLAGTDVYPESSKARQAAWEAYKAKQAAGTLGLRTDNGQPSLPSQRDTDTRYSAAHEPRLLHVARTAAEDEREAAVAALASQDPETHATSMIEHLGRVPSASLDAAHTVVRALTRCLEIENPAHQQLQETWHEAVQGKANLLGASVVANYLILE